MKNLKIGKKLGIAFIILLAMAVCGNFYAISRLNQSAKLNESLYLGPYEGTTEAMGIRRDLVSIGRNLTNAIFRENHADYSTTILSDFDSINERILKIEQSGLDHSQTVINLNQSMNELKQQYEKVYGLVQQGDTATAASITVKGTEYWAVYDKCVTNSLALYDELELRGSSFYEDIQSTLTKSKGASTAISMVSIVIGVVICVYITNSLKKPIEELEVAANKMAEGDFDIDISYESKDELGVLSDCMREVSSKTKEAIEDTVRVLGDIASGNFDVTPQANYVGVFKHIENSVIKITNDLTETMAQINVASEEVAAASDQVASGSQMLSQGATEQASSIQELSATIVEISEKIKDTAKNAQQANVLSISAGKEVEDGNNQMKQMVKAMEEISFTSNEIGRIIKTIDDIAFQTNILALNAAVEAARAGSAGKGFAVVADEVRNLAAKSAEAAKNTAILIESSIGAVNNGTNIVDNTAVSLRKIIETTNQTIDLVDEIAKASDEQAGAIAQVTLGIEQISAVVQTNSATSEESAASSEELSGQAQMLMSLMENFKLKDVDNNDRNIDFSNNGESIFSMSEF